MKLATLKKTMMTCAALTVLAAPAMANDMINNYAYGYVNGDITQNTPGFNNKLTVEVGSIRAKHMAQNNEAFGYVNGEIRQDAGGPWGVDDVTLTTKVGSITADTAMNNRATGDVDGSIIQEVYDRDALAEVHVGTIDAGRDGFAFGNMAEGRVNGQILQTVGYNSKARIRVGSMTD